MKDHYTVFYLIKACALPGRVEQSVTCLTTDPRVPSSIRVCFHSYVEIDHEIVSMVILLPSADFFKKGFVSYKGKYVHKNKNVLGNFICFLVVCFFFQNNFLEKLL